MIFNMYYFFFILCICQSVLAAWKPIDAGIRMLTFLGNRMLRSHMDLDQRNKWIDRHSFAQSKE